MKERQIIINGTNHQVTLTAEQVGRFRFIAVDESGKVWLFYNKPYIECTDCGCWSPDDELDEFEELDSYQGLPDIGDAWSGSLTKINSVTDPDAMADAIAELIRGRAVSEDLLAEVTAMIKAGN